MPCFVLEAFHMPLSFPCIPTPLLCLLLHAGYMFQKPGSLLLAPVLRCYSPITFYHITPDSQKANPSPCHIPVIVIYSASHTGLGLKAGVDNPFHAKGSSSAPARTFQQGEVWRLSIFQKESRAKHMAAGGLCLQWAISPALLRKLVLSQLGKEIS